MIDLSYCDIQGNVLDIQETANSYVISKPGNYCFPLVYGNAIKDGKDNLGAYTGRSGSSQRFDFLNHKNKPIKSPRIPYEHDKAKIVSWDSSREFIQGLKIHRDYIEFYVTSIPSDGANYVVAAIDATSRISWSWHIWLWKKKLENIDVYGKFKILNTNLAAKGERSWLYQYGRKDPICFFDKQFTVKPTADKLGKSIQNPGVFYLGNFWNYNWIQIKKNTPNFWNADDRVPGATIKSVYDPCPRNYHVPDQGVFTGIQCEHEYKHNNILLPGGTIINGSNGQAVDISRISKIKTGNYWSNSSVNNERVVGLSVSGDKGKYNYWVLYQEKSNGFFIRPQYDERS
jgi:hypothetical protein